MKNKNVLKYFSNIIERPFKIIFQLKFVDFLLADKDNSNLIIMMEELLLKFLN